MTSARMDFRIDEKIKAKVERASALLGMKSTTEYVISLIDANATKVIAEHEKLTVKDDIFDQFWKACQKARQPNQALRDAVAFTRDQGIK
jgi:uncharacterized protein (DUF1778 family)